MTFALVHPLFFLFSVTPEPVPLSEIFFYFLFFSLTCLQQKSHVESTWDFFLVAIVCYLSWISVSFFSWRRIRSKTFFDHVTVHNIGSPGLGPIIGWPIIYFFYCIIIYLETGRSGCGTASRTIGGRQPSSAPHLSPQPSCQTSVPCLHPHHLSGRNPLHLSSLFAFVRNFVCFTVLRTVPVPTFDKFRWATYQDNKKQSKKKCWKKSCLFNVNRSSIVA